MRYINKSKTLPEIFEEVRELSSVDEKVGLLCHYRTKSLEFFIYNLYHVDWSGLKVPKFEYNKFPPGIAVSSIHSSIDRLKAAHRLIGTNPKRSQELVQLVLESVTEDEANLLLSMFAGTRVEGISKAVFKKVYPEFFRPEVSAPETDN